MLIFDGWWCTDSMWELYMDVCVVKLQSYKGLSSCFWVGTLYIDCLLWSELKQNTGFERQLNSGMLRILGNIMATFGIANMEAE